MGTTYEPDGYETTVGTWGTDIDFETSASALSADGYWEFKSTAPAADPVLRYKDFIPVNELQPYGHHAWAYASSIAGGNTFRVATEWYDNAKALISTTDHFNSVLPSINTWHSVGGIANAPSTARYAKPLVSKSNIEFTVRVDRFDIKSTPISFWAYDSSGTSIGLGATRIDFDAEVHDYGGNFDSAANYRFVAPSDGVYSFTAAVTSLTTAGDYLFIGLRHNGASTFSAVKDGHLGGLAPRPVAAIAAVTLARGDTVDVVALVTGAGAHAASTGRYNTFFMGARVE